MPLQTPTKSLPTPSTATKSPAMRKPNTNISQTSPSKQSLTPPKKQRKIEFSEEDEVGQFKSDDTLETWYQASKST